jgi:formylmethanofuran dehydrogenase subunit E
MERMKSKDATQAERNEFKALHEKKAMEIMAQPPRDLFTVTEVSIPLPSRAKIEPSVQCDRCKEPTMASKLESVGGQSLCRGCLDRAS